ncbi:MAG: Rieske 2Fe-2S domain-containing protein [Candidatus Nanopelagicaceae bacterium]|nr:Rieske 2Fe-2S domain-containing protein [Candidatus Nanopelagicaceae bacterium]
MLQSSIRLIRSSWRNQSPGIRVIRLWLGATWIYAGWDKARDPGFLQTTGATYIGRQLAGYATTSPLGFIFRGLIEHATAVGALVMVVEFAIGLATLFWVAPTLAAFAGFSMSLGLWIAATWHVKPYFLGSDSAYAVLWLAYFLTLVGRRRRVGLSLDRRGVIRVGVVGAVAVVAAGAVHFFSRSKAVSTTGSKADPNRIIRLNKLAVGQTHEFVSVSGNPSILFRTTNGVFAYSEICTHQGCTIGYSPADKLLICPCHGTTYDPFNNAKVLSGPAPSPVPKVKVAIEGDWIVQA